MKLLKIPIPLNLVVVAIGAALGWGGTVAVASSRVARIEEKAAEHVAAHVREAAVRDERIKTLEKLEQDNRLWKNDVGHLIRQTNDSVKRIEKKLGIDE